MKETNCWIPYEQRRGHRADFKVHYRFYPEAEGGRKLLPFQGYRSDFAYEGDDLRETGVFAIHPEFEDENGDVVLDLTSPVPAEGTARMWILFPTMRKKVHMDRIKPGVIGYFMEGARRVAVTEVMEIVGLHENPVEELERE